tara:strand:- start:204 stop:533 length:330 start_codon:yes stop_codon:yes gene_type:complete
MKKINPKSQPGLEALKKVSPNTVKDMGYYKKGGSMPSQKLSRQQTKLLMKSGGELNNMMFGSITEKMRKGGNAKRLAKNYETGGESMQEYKLGGGTHNTYSGSSKKRKK